MNDKAQLLKTLREEFDRWEELLGGLSEKQIIAMNLPGNLSIKDVISHLRAWQQRSIARLEAALLNKEPEFPNWPAELDPESEQDLDKTNAWIYQTYHERPWTNVHRLWREGFLRFLELGEAIPEKDLFDTGKYAWMPGYSPADVLTASYEHHHQDHLEPLLAWLSQHGTV